jgi:tRNA 2-thiouridine synthesizing protein A
MNVPAQRGRSVSNAPDDWEYEALFDSEGRGCGEALLALKLRLRDLPAGARILVVSEDPGAALELPAWCRLTGHALEDARPPHFLVQKRVDPRKA